MTRVVLGLSGASGAAIGLRVAEILNTGGVETHLVVTPAAERTLRAEIDADALARLERLVHRRHAIDDIGAAIASGSFRTAGMVVAPCSMKTLAAVAHGLSDNLITRAADVVLKERRRLILMVRETPFNLAHLRNMTAVTEMGGIVFPPLPAFYHRPQTIAELVDETVERVLQLAGIAAARPQAWAGLGQTTPASPSRT